MNLAEPAWLLLLLLAPLPFLADRRRPRLAWPTAGAPGVRAGRLRAWSLLVPPLLRASALALLAVALARPQVVSGRIRVAARGVAIVAALDRSGSMAADDFVGPGGGPPVTRLEAALATFARFVAGRPDDLIGLVAFANVPDLACPPTLDHGALLDAAAAIRPARAGEDGTNLGDAVAWALDALRDASPPKKVLVLLTDGRNRPGVPDPLDPRAAADLARSLGVTLHTIALGGEGGLVRRPDPATGLPLIDEVEGPDLALLRAMAERGGGRSFVAADPEALDAVFAELDALERSTIAGTVRTRYAERFAPWAAAALACLVLDRLLSATALRRLP